MKARDLMGRGIVGGPARQRGREEQHGMPIKNGLVVAEDSVVVDGLVPQFRSFLGFLAAVFQTLFGFSMVITSGLDGVHAYNSLHKVGRAVDIRTKDLTPVEQVVLMCIVAYLSGKTAIAAFDERNVAPGQHLHLEWHGA